MARVLAVDDSPSMRRMVSFTLRNAGHEVIEACDGEEAYELAAREQVELVLTDINMPRMDGVTLIAKLRALPQYRHTPILTLTTESGEAKKNEGRAAGATGWIVKPFHPEKLTEVVARLVG